MTGAIKSAKATRKTLPAPATARYDAASAPSADAARIRAGLSRTLCLIVAAMVSASSKKFTRNTLSTLRRTKSPRALSLADEKMNIA
jgi:hypothetical protein